MRSATTADIKINSDITRLTDNKKPSKLFVVAAKEADDLANQTRGWRLPDDVQPLEAEMKVARALRASDPRARLAKLSAAILSCYISKVMKQHPPSSEGILINFHKRLMIDIIMALI